MTRLLLLLSTALMLSACSTNLVVTGDYPTPMVHVVPVTAALFMDEAFTNYQYVDTEEGSSSLIMQIGAAQTKMFDKVSGGLFRSSQRLTVMPDSRFPANVDLILVPHVEQVQVTTPKQTKLKVYEVWVKYNLQVFNSSGEPIADWVMTAYGKTPSRTMTSDSSALNLASVAALRDAGTRIATGFCNVPDIRQWLDQQLASTKTINEADHDLALQQ